MTQFCSHFIAIKILIELFESMDLLIFLSIRISFKFLCHENEEV